jgi:aryl-alcohol dehydrogenase-like predicted oxidoreductase
MARANGSRFNSGQAAAVLYQPMVLRLGIGFVPYSPLGHGFLTGAIRSVDDLADNDWRKTNPRMHR